MWHHGGEVVVVAVRSRLWSKPGALILGAAVLVAGYLALSVMVSGQHILREDRQVRQWVNPHRNGRLEVPMQTVSRLGEAAGLVPAILGASVVFGRVRRRWAVLFPSLMAGTGALQYLAKWAADRPRPNAAPWGFPSGHVLSLTVFWGIVAYLILTTWRRRHRWRILACAGCAAIVAAVAVSRIYLDMHWISDVIGGFAAGCAYLLLALGVYEFTLGRPGASAGDGEGGVTLAIEHLDGAVVAARHPEVHRRAPNP